MKPVFVLITRRDGLAGPGSDPMMRRRRPFSALFGDLTPPRGFTLLVLIKHARTHRDIRVKLESCYGVHVIVELHVLLMFHDCAICVT